MLDRLLSTEFPGAQELRRQTEKVVARSCSCGTCGSIHLRVTDDAVPRAALGDPPASLTEPRRRPRTQVASTATIPPTSEHPGGGVILNLARGQLSYLEIYSYGEVIRELPHPDDMRWELA